MDHTHIQCHYDVLSVARDADSGTIKKAHRKMALRYHPDKNIGDEAAAEQFRLVQQAYECLSDPSERKWYDQHRDAILKGWSSGGAQQDLDILFDVVPYHFSGCYSGYDNGEGGFFAVYTMVFQQVYEGEHQGWISEGNVEDMPLAYLPTDFGNADTDWEVVCAFYQAWESFTSCLSFAWADVYDTKEAPNRRIRRAMEEDNKKARRNERRARNDDIRALVQFCKKRDPRVRAQRERAEQERVQKENEKIEAAKRKKVLAAEAREAWKAENERAMADFEEEDRMAGRVRLADLDDGYDYGGGKRGKKGRKKKRNSFMEEEDDDDEEDDDEAEDEVKEEAAVDNNAKDETTESSAQVEANGAQAENSEKVEAEIDAEPTMNTEDLNDLEETILDDSEEDYVSEEETESEPEPDFWRCECCRKDFKSEGQMENHMKSKKHKESYKKFQGKKKKEETVEDLLEELVLED